MKVKIALYYHTQYGESLHICGSSSELGSNIEENSLEMSYTEPDLWSIEFEVVGNQSKIDYHFLLKTNGKTIRKEEGCSHYLHLSYNHSFEILDFWHNTPVQNYLYTSGFASSFFFHKPSEKLHYYPNSLLLIVRCPYVKSDEELIIIGESDVFGNWDANKGLKLDNITHDQWSLTLDGNLVNRGMQYKLAIRNIKSQQIAHWEQGDNRSIEFIGTANIVKAEALDYRHELLYWKASGVAIPIFSLRSNSSFGIGDFTDLTKMIDWAVMSGQKVVQLLPINDTTTTRTWLDSYPYNCISNYALHPIYLGLSEYPLGDVALNNNFLAQAKILNDLDTVDYEAVLELKTNYIKELYKEKGSFILGECNFHKFYEHNKGWLFPYAAFCYLRDRHNGADITQWGEYSVYDVRKVEQLVLENPAVKENFRLTYFTQFLLDQQLSKAKNYAHQSGVILKGDIPIGVNRNSVEAWTEPQLFNLDSQTGAPPDDFSANGQNWGFPTYNWNEMSKDGFAWWKKRFSKMADYFDAYRIDHILGFFRIWEIPQTSVQGILGHFSPALPLSIGEIQDYGFPFDEQRMTNAYVSARAIQELFGEYEQEITSNYFHKYDEDVYELNEDCNTQLKIKQLFENRNDDKSQLIKNGLYEVCNEVLFIRDKNQLDRFHPRISAYNSFYYKNLPEEYQAAYYRLYEDFFYHRHNQFWGGKAMSKLPVLTRSTSMLVCGEDLGMIPSCVPQVMDELQILSLEIERMPKEFGVEFGNTSKYSFMSVCTTSTHDMSPIRQWWEENPDATQYYYNNVLQRQGVAPQICSSDICWQILHNHLHSPSMLCIIPLQDWLSFWDGLRRADPNAERINVPSNPKHNWNYRMHIRLEDLLEASDYNNTVKKIIIDAQRS